MIVFSNLWGKDTKKAESIKTFGLFSLSEEDYSLARASIFLLMSSITSSVSSYFEMIHIARRSYIVNVRGMARDGSRLNKTIKVMRK